MKPNENGYIFRVDYDRLWQNIGQLKLVAHNPYILENTQLNAKEIQYNIINTLKSMHEEECLSQEEMNTASELVEKTTEYLEMDHYSGAADYIEKLEEKIQDIFEHIFEIQDNW